VPRIIALHGEDHPETALILRNESSALREVGRFAEADAGYRRVIAIDTRLHGPEHGQVGRTRYQLGRSLMAQRRWAEAEVEMRRAFTILQRDHGDDHGWTRQVAAAQVDIYEALGRPKDAARCRAYLPDE
jgi:tetratricopeptide (TPR) repeat protein